VALVVDLELAELIKCKNLHIIFISFILPESSKHLSFSIKFSSLFPKEMDPLLDICHQGIGKNILFLMFGIFLQVVVHIL
jgi:hypothetical protein